MLCKRTGYAAYDVVEVFAGFEYILTGRYGTRIGKHFFVFRYALRLDVHVFQNLYLRLAARAPCIFGITMMI